MEAKIRLTQSRNIYEASQEYEQDDGDLDYCEREMHFGRWM